jgi:hypothetical protein
MNIKTIGMNTSLTFQWLIEPQSMKQSFATVFASMLGIAKHSVHLV